MFERRRMSIEKRLRMRRVAGDIKALQVHQIGARDKRAWDLQSGVIGRSRRGRRRSFDRANSFCSPGPRQRPILGVFGSSVSYGRGLGAPMIGPSRSGVTGHALGAFWHRLYLRAAPHRPRSPIAFPLGSGSRTPAELTPSTSLS